MTHNLLGDGEGGRFFFFFVGVSEEEKDRKGSEGANMPTTQKFLSKIACPSKE